MEQTAAPLPGARKGLPMATREQSYHEIAQADDTIPPPPGSTGADRQTPTDTYLIAQVNGAKRASKEALALAEKAHAGIGRLERTIGQSPDATQGIQGAGLLGTVANMIASVDGLRDELVEDRNERKRVDALLAKQAEIRSARFRAVGATIGAIVGLLAIAKTLWELFHK